MLTNLKIASPIAGRSSPAARAGLANYAAALALMASGLACSQNHDGMGGTRIAAATHLASAGMLERQKNTDAAIRQYEDAIKSDPHLAEAYFGLGRLHFRLKQFEDAAGALGRGIASQCDVPSLHNNLGVAYLQMRKLEEAERAFRRALELSPKFVKARMNLAITLARMDRISDSVDQFSEVVHRDDAFFNIAVIRADEDDYAGATHALRDALAYNPSYEPAMDHLDRIERIARADEAAKAAVARLAARNTLAGFSEPVASAAATSPNPCVVPDGGLNEARSASMVLPSGIETRSAVEQKPVVDDTAGHEFQPESQAQAQTPRQPDPEPIVESKPEAVVETNEAEFVGPIYEAPAPPVGRIVSYSVPCLNSESGRTAATAPHHVEIEDTAMATPTTKCDEPAVAHSEAPSDSTPKSKTTNRTLTSGRASRQSQGKIIAPTYTAPTVADRTAGQED